MYNLEKALIIIEVILIILQIAYLLTGTPTMFFLITMLISWVVMGYSFYIIFWKKR